MEKTKFAGDGGEGRTTRNAGVLMGGLKMNILKENDISNKLFKYKITSSTHFKITIRVFR